MGEREEFRRELGQLLWIGFEGTHCDLELAAELRAGRAGGVILFRRNLVYSEPEEGQGTPQLAIEPLIDLNDAMRTSVSAGQAPLFVAVDQEGGRVQRVRDPATRWPPMIALDHAGDQALELARKVGRAMGEELAAVDFDIDFAPVLDVNTNPENPIIGDRAFSTDPERAATLALAFAEGLIAAGLLPCGKHFPGHGDTTADSHLELPRVDRRAEELDRIELLPFRRAAEANLPMLMTAHVIFSSLDAERPATLSPQIVGDLLRGTLGYQGLVISDDIDMKAIADHYGVGEASERAILAGCDVLLLCRDRDHQIQAFEGLIRAAESRSELRDRIRASARRVHRQKRDHFKRKQAQTVPGRERIGHPEHRALAAELASRLEDAGN